MQMCSYSHGLSDEEVLEFLWKSTLHVYESEKKCRTYEK